VVDCWRRAWKEKHRESALPDAVTAVRKSAKLETQGKLILRKRLKLDEPKPARHNDY